MDQMREALTAAYEKHAVEAEKETPVEETVVQEPVAEPEKVEAAPVVVAEKVVEPDKQVDASADKPTDKPVAASTEAPAPVVAAKAPRSWSAEAKAAFAALPEPVKNDVLRREKEISQGLEQAAPARKHYESFQEVVKPFQPLFDAYGVADPLPAIRQLLTTRATFEIGTPEQKAQLVANLVHEFGIDIQMLDANLVKKGPVKSFTPARPVPRAAYTTDPALAPLYALAEQFKQAQVQKAEAEVAKIETMPHFDDLREDIADVVEAFASNGKTISLENAYKRALAMNPSLEPAPAVPQITKSQAAAILASRNAASSISGTPRTGASPAPIDRRAQLVAAWEANRAS
jgi:hypothetical protein